MNIRFENKEGLEFLKTVESNSIDLILTDPPYITSRETGMDKWVDHVAKQDKAGAKNVKTIEQWNEYKTAEDWIEWLFLLSLTVSRKPSFFFRSLCHKQLFASLSISVGA